MAKQYLDDNGNPIAAPAATPTAGGGAKTYLDDNGNPIQSKSATPSAPTPPEPGPLQSLANWGERTFPRISSSDTRSPQYQQYDTFRNHPETARNILNFGSSYLRSLTAAPESLKQWATQSLTPQGSIQAIAERGNAPGTTLKPGKRPAEPTVENVGDYVTDLVGGAAAGATLGELGAAGLRGLSSIPRSAKGLARALTGTGPQAAADLAESTHNANVAEVNRAEGVNRGAAEKHLTQTQEALHTTTGNELSYQQKVNEANRVANEANKALDRQHETDVRNALEKTRQAEDLHNQELANARLKGEDAYQKKLKEVEEARTKAEQDRRKELREYMKKKSDIIAENQKVQGAQSRKTAAAHGVKRIDETLRGDLNSTREKVKAEADSRYANQRAELNKKQIPWNPADAENPNAITNENIIGKITDAWDTSITGSEGRPPVIKSIAERINRNEPMTWRDLQGYRSEISKKLSSGTLPGDEYHAYTKALNIIDDGMQKIADANGMGRQVASDRAFYRQYMETFMDPSSPVYKAMHASERGGTINALMNMDRSGIETVARYNPELAKRLNAGRNALEVAKAPAGGTLKSLPKLGERPVPIESPERPGEPQVAPPVRAEIPNRPSPIQPTMPAPFERVAPPNRPPTESPTIQTIRPEEIQGAKRESLQNRADQIRKYGRRIASYGAGVHSLWDAFNGNFAGVGRDVAMGAAGYGATEAFARMLERPDIQDLLTKPTAADIAQIPPELRRNLRPMLESAQSRGVRVSPLLLRAAGIGGGVAGALRPAGQGNQQ